MTTCRRTIDEDGKEQPIPIVERDSMNSFEIELQSALLSSARDSLDVGVGGGAWSLSMHSESINLVSIKTISTVSSFYGSRATWSIDQNTPMLVGALLYGRNLAFNRLEVSYVDLGLYEYLGGFYNF